MNNRKFFGFLLIAFGIGYILQQLDIIRFSDIIRNYWPVIIIIVGIIQISTNSVSKIGGLIIIAIGALIQLNKLDIIKNLGGFFWPIILILAGIKILFPGSNVNNSKEINDDIIDYFVAFSGIDVKNSSSNFKGGSITALFGGGDIDLRNATLSNEGAVIDAFIAFGGADIKVPNGWKVIITGVPIFGGFDNKTSNTELATSTPILKVRCVALFGGIDVKN